MNSVSFAKVATAFLTGVVLALGSALMYVKVSSGQSAPDPVEQASVAPPQPPAVAASQTPAVATPEAKPDSTDSDDAAPAPPLEKRQAPAKHNVKRQAAKSVPAPRQQPPSLVQVAQIEPPPPEQVNPDQPNQSPPAPATPAPAPAPASDPVVTQPQLQAEPQAPQPATTPPPAREPKTVTVESGTNLVIRLGEALSTDHNYSGDTFRGTLELPLVIDGFIIAERGSKVLGRIVTVQKGGHVQGVSDLNLTLTEINTTDGQRVPVETNGFDKRGPSAVGSDAARVAGGAAIGAIIGAIAGGGKGAGIGAGVGGAAGAGDVMLSRPKPAVLPNETELTFRLTQPVTITEKLN